jgi:hypothetical protein
MAIVVPIASQKMLLELGLCPPGCSNIQIVMPASGAMVLRYDVFVTAEHLDKLSLLFQLMASEAKAKQDGADGS